MTKSTLTNIINKFIKIVFVFSVFLTVSVSIASFSNVGSISTSAAGIEDLQPTGLKCIFFDKDAKASNPKGCTESSSLVTVIVKFLQDIAPFVATILIIFGGYEYFSDENAKKTSAKSTIFAAISGYIIIILAPVITEVIKKTFNGDPKNPIDSKALIELLTKITDVLINLSSVVAVVVIILGGYAYFVQFFVNGGKQEGKINGRELILAGVMGLIVTIIAKPLVAFIRQFLKVTDSNNNIILTTQENTVIELIRTAISSFLIPFASLTAVVFIVLAAYQWLTAGESEEKAKNARKTLNGALVGLVVALLATTIVQLIVFFTPSSNFTSGNTGTGTQLINTPNINPTNN